MYTDDANMAAENVIKCPQGHVEHPKITRVMATVTMRTTTKDVITMVATVAKRAWANPL